MALSTAQRNRLPRSAFAYAPAGSPRSAWRYPVPTPAQARAAGISAAENRRVHRAARAYASRYGVAAHVHPVVARRRAGAPSRAAAARGRGAPSRAPARRSATAQRGRSRAARRAR